MAFIAVNAKADVEGSKKGRLTPAQNAVINAFSLAKQTGILDIGGKCVASVTKTDMASHYAEVTFSNGFFVVQGRFVQCEDGTIVTVDLPTSGTQYGNIVARFSPSSAGNAEFQVIAKTGELTQNNLHTEQTGVYEFSLCEYTATPTGLSLNMNKDYIISAESVAKERQADLTRIEGNGQDFGGVKPTLYTNAPLNGYRREKGSVETRLGVIVTDLDQAKQDINSAKQSISSLDARLANMGFKQGRIDVLSDAGATLTKVGTYAILKIPRMYRSENGWISYKMSFTSNETFDVVGATETTGQNFTVRLTQGSNILQIGCINNVTMKSTQIGFVISGW